MRLGRNRRFVFYLIAFCAMQEAFAGDVLYTMWQDEEERLWVRFENHLDSAIQIQEISFVFYNRKGKPVGDHKLNCSEKCSMASRDVRDFGPVSPPATYASARVRNVQYIVE